MGYRRSNPIAYLLIALIFAGIIMAFLNGNNFSFGGNTSAPIITRALVSKLYGDGNYSADMINTTLFAVLIPSKFSLNAVYSVTYNTKNGTAIFLVFNTTTQLPLISNIGLCSLSFTNKKKTPYCTAGVLYDFWKNYINTHYILTISGKKNYSMTAFEKNNYIIFVLLTDALYKDINATLNMTLS